MTDDQWQQIVDVLDMTDEAARFFGLTSEEKSKNFHRSADTGPPFTCALS